MKQSILIDPTERTTALQLLLQAKNELAALAYEPSSLDNLRQWQQQTIASLSEISPIAASDVRELSIYIIDDCPISSAESDYQAKLWYVHREMLQTLLLAIRYNFLPVYDSQAH